MKFNIQEIQAVTTSRDLIYLVFKKKIHRQNNKNSLRQVDIPLFLLANCLVSFV